MIRPGELADFEAVTHIRETVALDVDRLHEPDYRVRVQRAGFLLPTDLDMEDFQANLPGYSVYEQDEEVRGYISLRGHQTMQSGVAAHWLKPELESHYHTLPHAYIGAVGVLPSAKQRGIATELLQTAEQQARDRHIPWLFSMIVVSPVTNVASMMLHERHGFERAALLDPARVSGMDGFQNLLYGKQIREKADA